MTGVNIVIPFAGRALKPGHLTLSGMMRGEEEQKTKSLRAQQVGEIAALDDPRFSQATAEAACGSSTTS